MKKRITLLFAMLAALVTTAMADNVISAEPLKIAKSGLANLTINLTNDVRIRGLQFKVTLPEGFSGEATTDFISYQDGEDTKTYKPENAVKVYQTDRTTGITVLGNKVSDSEYMFVLISMTAEAIDEGEGAIMKITFKTSSAVEVGGEYAVQIADIHLAQEAGDELTPAAISTDMSVLKKGDVNGDNKVNVTDCICVIDYIFKEPNEELFETMVDVNSDKNVNVSDVISIIDIIFGNPTQTRGDDDEYELQDPD